LLPGGSSRVEGDPDAPIYKGFFCPKGCATTQHYGNPNRLLHGLKRLPDGRQLPITSAQAIDEIAERLQ
jgi:anaerobic selenocysteine-containing dehydrogenase